MTRWIRFFLVALHSMWRPKLGPDDTSVLTGRVWPTDVDVSVANQSAYAVYFEMARVDLQLRTGLAKLAAKRGWSAPLASINVQFRKPLKRFQKFKLSARIAYWDDKWIYVEHRIARHGKTIATALSKSLVIGREGRIAPLKLAAELGMSVARPSMPPMIEKYLEAERLMHEHVDAWSCTLDSLESAG